MKCPQRARNPGGRSRISLRSIRATEATMSRPTVGDRTRRLEDFSGTLVLVGAGKMGGAMLEGWIALGIDPAKILVIEPKPSRELMKLVARGLRVNPGDPPAEASVIILAVKPQVADDVVPARSPWDGPASLVLSIMAGRKLQGLERALP